MEGMQTGVVKKVVTEKGFGFIKPDAGGKDVFFHVNDTAADVDFKSLQGGEAVQYEVMESPKGLKAVNVMLA